MWVFRGPTRVATEAGSPKEFHRGVSQGGAPGDPKEMVPRPGPPGDVNKGSHSRVGQGDFRGD
jgi:hypothetical protein